MIFETNDDASASDGIDFFNALTHGEDDAFISDWKWGECLVSVAA